LAAGAAAACLFAAPSALADSALDQYQRSGQIDPCTASTGGGIPNDVEQYAPDYLEALKDAQRRGCNRAGVSQTKPTETKNGVPVTSAGTLPPGSTYVPKPPAPPKTFRDDKVVKHLPLAAGRDVTTPVPVIVLAVMALLALVGGALVGTSRYMGWGFERSGAVRHAFGELGFRLRNLTRRDL
jgi:hypothetical protein